jgi:hypothetical protein
MNLLRPILVSIALCIASALHAQDPQSRASADSVIRQIVHTRDGSTLVGRVVSEDSVSVRIETSGGILTIARTNVLSIETVHASDVHEGEYWFPDPNRTRLFFAPTARMLDEGEGYYMNTYLILQSFAGGLSKYVTIGGGFSLVPGVNPTEWLYYATPKVGVYQSNNINVAVGALIGALPDATPNGFGVLFGVATKGGPNGSVTAGAGYGFAGSSIASRPVFLVGGEQRVSRRVALITENYVYSSRRTNVGCVDGPCPFETKGIVSYGLRFMGEKLSVDFAFFNAPGETDWIFPGIPYLSFGVKF